MVPLAKVGHLAEVVASRSASRCPGVQREDIVQEAWAAMLSAMKRGKYDADQGSATSYLIGAGFWSAHALNRKTRSVVARSAAAVPVREPHHPLCEPAEEWNRAEWDSMVRAELKAESKNHDGGEIAVAIILGECTSREAAVRTGRSAKSLYHLVYNVKRRLRGNKRLRVLAGEIG